MAGFLSSVASFVLLPFFVAMMAKRKASSRGAGPSRPVRKKKNDDAGASSSHGPRRGEATSERGPRTKGWNKYSRRKITFEARVDIPAFLRIQRWGNGL